jgi:predicted MFS family arabinose efflux permease
MTQYFLQEVIRIQIYKESSNMLEQIKRNHLFISIVFITVTMATLLFWPEFSRTSSIVILLASFGMATVFIAQNHWHAYQQAECTREKMTRNLSFDLIGLLLTMAAASSAGGAAGQWAGTQAGLWAGLAAGFLVGFLATWIVRFAWGRLVPVR